MSFIHFVMTQSGAKVYAHGKFLEILPNAFLPRAKVEGLGSKR